MEELNLSEYIYIIQRKFWIIALITIISVIISGVVSFYVLVPEYETFTTLILGKQNTGMAANETIQYNDVLLNQKLVSTYGQIVKSRLVSNEVIRNLKLKLKPEEFEKKVKVTLVNDTEIIKIVINDNDPELAARIANETAQVFKRNVANIMKIENIQIIDKAEVPEKPEKPRPIFNMAMYGLFGMMISVLLIFLLDYMDNTLKTPSDIERYLDLPIIGMIPKIPEKKEGKI